MSEMRLVTNVGDRPYTDGYAGTTYLFNPGATQVVPKEAADLWFGDPTVRNEKHRRRREQEYDRLRIRYGGFDDNDIFEENRPRVKVTSIDGETEFTTVLDDPQGDTVHDAIQTVNEHAELVGLIEQQQREVAELREMLKKNMRAEKSMAAAGDLPTDDPEPVPSQAARKRAAKRGASKLPDGLDEAIESVRLDALPVDSPTG